MTTEILQKRILFIDKELLPIYGFKSIMDYESVITQKSLNKKSVEHINKILSVITQIFPKNLFNLHKTDGKIQTTKQTFNLLKKCLTSANVPFCEWTKRVDDKNINYLRLQEVNNILYKYIQKMQEIQQLPTEQICIPKVQTESQTVDTIPTKKLLSSELYKLAKKSKNIKFAITNFGLCDGVIRISSDMLHMESIGCIKSLSFKFVPKKIHDANIFDETLSDKITTRPVSVKLEFTQANIELIHHKNYTLGTNVLPENTVLPICWLDKFRTLYFMITPDPDIANHLKDYVLHINMIETNVFKKQFKEYLNGKCSFIIDTIGDNYGFYYKDNQIIPLHKKVIHDETPQSEKSDKIIVKCHVTNNNETKTYQEDVTKMNIGNTDDLYCTIKKIGTRCEHQVLSVHNIIGDPCRLGCAHTFQCANEYETYHHEINDRDTFEPRIYVKNGNYIQMCYDVMRIGDTCTGLVFCFAHEIEGIKFELKANLEVPLEHKKITALEYQNLFKSPAPFYGAGSYYMITNINLNNQINLIGCIWHTIRILINVPNESFAKFYITPVIHIVKSLLYYHSRQARKTVAQCGPWSENTFATISPVMDIFGTIFTDETKYLDKYYEENKVNDS
jgi:hypothetical protein